MPIGTPHGTLDYKQVSKVTFVGASSNTVIDTTTGSLGVGVGVGGPTSNLHVVGNTRLEGDINMLHTANTASIKLNSNVVTEFPRSKKFIKYPRVALTSAAQTGSGYEGYFVSQDSATLTGTSDRQAWALFDNVLAGAGPHFDGSGARYDNSGIYTGGDSLGGISGDWAYIRLPDKIQLHSVDLWARYNDIRNPIDATVMGSLNGTNWSVLGSWKNAKFAAGKSTSFNLNSIQYYNYIGFVFEKIEANSSGGYVNFHEIELFGTPEYDPEAHGTDVTVKSYPNVPNTDGLERYYDAKNYSYGSTILDELTATHRDATINGSVPLDTSSGINSWSFNGNTSNFISGDDNVDGIPPGGDWVHSMSIWFKTTDMSNDQNIAMILPSAYLNGGSLATGSASAFYLRGRNSGSSPNHLQIVHWSQDVRINYIFNEDEWYHLTYAYSGGGVSSASQHTYINGVHVPLLESTRSSSTAGDPLNTSSVSRVVLGKRYLTGNEKPFTGSIANFRLFNRALTSDEIYQLYAYQKEYFGHGDLSMTLKAGRLGIGTSEPRAMLDVRGDIFGRGIIQVQSTTFNGITSGNSNSFTTLPGLTTKITPKRPGSKILVLLNLFWSGPTDAYFQGNVKKDGTVLVKQEGSVGSASKTSFASYNYDRAIYCLGNIGFSYLDDSNIGTQPIEYTVEVRNRYSGSRYWYINYTSDTADANRLTGVSTLTLLEIQQ